LVELIQQVRPSLLELLPLGFSQELLGLQDHPEQGHQIFALLIAAF